MGAASGVKLAIGDAVMTFLWVFCASTLGLFTSLITTALVAKGVVVAPPLITTVLVFFLVLVFNPIGEMLGGASFNPTGNAAFYAVGAGSDNLISMALRFPAQAIGALGGAVAITQVVPLQYQHMIGGPSLKVDLHTGAFAEGLLTFFITFAVLFIFLRGPNSPFLKTCLLSISTVALVMAGSAYTGPSMNPANAFGWAYIYKRHNTWEQLYVYWICPFVGAILAAWIFRVVLPPPPIKHKKA